MPNVEGVLELYEEFDPDQKDKKFLADRIERVLEDPAYHLFIEEIGAVVVGTAMGVVIENLVGDGRPEMIVSNVVVHPSVRKRGIARDIFDQIEDWAIKMNCRKISVVSHHKFKVDKFYQSLGYESETSSVFIKRI